MLGEWGLKILHISLTFLGIHPYCRFDFGGAKIVLFLILQNNSPSILEGVAVGRGSNMKNRKSPYEIIFNLHVRNYQ